MKNIETELDLVGIVENNWEPSERDGEIVLYDEDDQDVRIFYRKVDLTNESYVTFGVQLWGEMADWEDTFVVEVHRVGAEIDGASIKLVAASDSQTPAWFSREVVYDSKYGRVVRGQEMVKEIPMDGDLVDVRGKMFFEYEKLPKEVDIEATVNKLIEQLNSGKVVRPTLVPAS